jgi:hypothetical protein
MEIQNFSFGTIRIDGIDYTEDIVLRDGKVCLRDKIRSREYREAFGHTPLSLKENIPWQCERLIVGTGVDGKLPVLPEVSQEAKRRRIELLVVTTPQAIELLRKPDGRANAILHLTC